MAIDRAPSRGCYTREASAIERFRAQRRRILEATALAQALGQHSVSSVARIAGIGRSTFYECFDDYPHALAAAVAFAGREVVSVLEGVRQRAVGVERLHSLCGEWIRFAVERPAMLNCALLSDAAAAEFVGVALSCREAVAVARDARQSLRNGEPSVAGPRTDEALALGVSACATEVARSVALAALRRDFHVSSQVTNSDAAPVRDWDASGPLASLQMGSRLAVANDAERGLSAALWILLR